MIKGNKNMKWWWCILGNETTLNYLGNERPQNNTFKGTVKADNNIRKALLLIKMLYNLERIAKRVPLSNEKALLQCQNETHKAIPMSSFSHNHMVFLFFEIICRHDVDGIISV